MSLLDEFNDFSILDSSNDENRSGNQLNNNNDSFYRDLFNFFDPQNTGYISVENFINISKENLPDENVSAI